MAYIIVVNPQILSQAAMPAESVMFATCLSSAACHLFRILTVLFILRCLYQAAA
jgi:xanthine/uracil/vitamin C permease (AzgA family)